MNPFPGLVRFNKPCHDQRIELALDPQESNVP